MLKPMPDNLRRRLDEVMRQYEEIGGNLLDPAVLADHRQVRSLSMKRASIEPLASAYSSLRRVTSEIADTARLAAEEPDAELRALAREEIARLEGEGEALTASITRRLVTAEDRGVGSIILEVRAGVGGDEAALFARDLGEMYQRFAFGKGWTCELMQASPGDAGGFKSMILRISGPGVWSEMGYEGGTHQVKRVPATEAQGRVHTSTATVAVLPEPEEVEVTIKSDEVREIMTTSQGPGGQNVNKVATAVHLIHLPTGLEVKMQETKSQAQNRERAWALLRARLYERQRAELHAQRTEARNSMIGSGSRSEKIRTYRWKENAVVDHRLGSGDGSFNLAEVIAGRMQALVDALVEQDLAQRIASL